MKDKKDRILIEAKKKFWGRVQIYCAFGIGFMLCFLLFAYQEYKDYSTSGVEAISDCNGTLYETAGCLRDDLVTFYNYNLSNAGAVLTEEQLREQGGVCEQYAKWYKVNMESRGYNAELVMMQIEGRQYHMVTIASDEEGYCLLDQQIINCYEFTK
jgi:hypothetical protein